MCVLSSVISFSIHQIASHSRANACLHSYVIFKQFDLPHTYTFSLLLLSHISPVPVTVAIFIFILVVDSAATHINRSTIRFDDCSFLFDVPLLSHRHRIITMISNSGHIGEHIPSLLLLLLQEYQCRSAQQTMNAFSISRSMSCHFHN